MKNASAEAIAERPPVAAPESSTTLPSDARLCDEVAARVARPKRAAADSFVLHAPLELLARTALLPLVASEARDAARERIAALGRDYAAAGSEVNDPVVRRDADPVRAAADLVAALAAGELDDADAAAAVLAERLDTESLVRALADEVLPRLGAAAHGSIFLFQLPRIAPRSRGAARMLRPLVRELAREHAWRLGWFRTRSERVAPASALVERLLVPTSPGDPGSPFIYPTMHLVESSGLAAELLDGPTRALDPALASRLLGRVAAWSMLQDESAAAPYGWSHALSIPQATLGLAHACRVPADAVAVAATYVLGFRATLGRVRLDPEWAPPRPPRTREVRAALEGSVDEAVAAAWHAPADLVPEVVEALATRASRHHDAHLVKYTLACLDARRADPDAAHLYLAAAAYLSAWWRREDAARAG